MSVARILQVPIHTLCIVKSAMAYCYLCRKFFRSIEGHLSKADLSSFVLEVRRMYHEWFYHGSKRVVNVSSAKTLSGTITEVSITNA